jgi:hypothetical protein
VRRQIAEHMLRSRRTSPHVTTVMEADLSRVVAHRQAHKETFARDGVELTFSAYFVVAAVAALKAVPWVNASWSDDGIVLHRSVNVGMAVSLGEQGLIVPVIKDADQKSLLAIASAIKDLAARARARQLKPDEVQGGTFTITNHGVSGSLFATNHQSTPGRHPRRGGDPSSGRRRDAGSRCVCHSPEGVSDADLRSPHADGAVGVASRRRSNAGEVGKPVVKLAVARAF